MQGRVLRFGEGGVVVRNQNGKDVNCQMRGKLRKQQVKVLVGDVVQFDEQSLAIEQVLPRKNELIRPKVANIDQILICVSKEPYPDLLLVDKLIISAQRNKIEPIVCITKTDLTDKAFVEEVTEEYEAIGVRVVSVSAKDKQNINEIKKLLCGKTAALAGQSGVGKSTLLNALNPSLMLKTGELTSKLQRGKNTTTATQIYELEDNALVLDTPGFSVLELEKITAQDFLMAYPDIYKYASECQYKSCNHLNKTPDECGVTRAVLRGDINKNRFLRFNSEYSRLAGLRIVYEKKSKTNKTKGKKDV